MRYDVIYIDRATLSKRRWRMPRGYNGSEHFEDKADAIVMSLERTRVVTPPIIKYGTQEWGEYLRNLPD